MATRMKVENLDQQNNTVSATISVENSSPRSICEFIINGYVKLEMRWDPIANKTNYNSGLTTFKCYLFAKFVKTSVTDPMDYQLQLSINKLVSQDCLSTYDTHYRIVHECEMNTYQYSFSINASVFTIDVFMSFASIFDDDDLTDFELRGSDGSVRMHKSILAAASPVLRRMLAGEWKETKEGCVDIPGMSKITLQNFKEYLYTQRLPKTGIEDILLLAVLYLIPDLEQKCVHELMGTLNAENALTLLKFSIENGSSRLSLAILECIQNGSVKVMNMREHFLQTN